MENKMSEGKITLELTFAQFMELIDKLRASDNRKEYVSAPPFIPNISDTYGDGTGDIPNGWTDDKTNKRKEVE